MEQKPGRQFEGYTRRFTSYYKEKVAPGAKRACGELQRAASDLFHWKKPTQWDKTVEGAKKVGHKAEQWGEKLEDGTRKWASTEKMKACCDKVAGGCRKCMDSCKSSCNKLMDKFKRR